MAVDPNWLPSTLAQSTAALVAIVGGLLVTRLVTLSSERGSLAHRRADVAGRRSRLVKDRDKEDTERFFWCLDDLWASHKDALLDAEGKIDVDDVLDDRLPIGADSKEMHEALGTLAQIVAEAFRAIRLGFPATEFPTGDISHLRDKIGPINRSEEFIYTAVAKRLADRKRDKMGVLTAKSSSLGSLISQSSARNVEPQQRRLRRIAELDSAIATLDLEISLIDEQKYRFAQPEGVTRGLVVLSLFAALGIVLPMVYMAWRPVPSSPGWRILLIVAFVVGFAVLIDYIVRLVKRLNRDLSDDKREVGA